MANPNLLAILDHMQQNHSETMQLITNLVERLAPINNPNNPQNPHNNNDERPQNREPMWDGGPRVEISDFSGSLKPEEFFNWTSTVEKFFELKKVPPDKRVSLVTIQLRDRAATWWQSYKFRRYLDCHPPLNNWFDLKREMTSEFLPLNYRQSENRDRQPRHDSKSFTNICPHHCHYNISSNIVSPSPQKKKVSIEENFKNINCLPCSSKEENFNREDEKINPFHSNKSLVACDKDDRYQPHTPSSTCCQQVDQKATTPVEKRQEQPDEHADRLVMVEKIEEPDDEGEANTLTYELKTKTVIVKNSSTLEEVFVGDFPMLTDNLANYLFTEVRYNFLLRTKHSSFTNNEAMTANYNDLFLQPSSKLLTIEVESISLISRTVQQKHMCRKSNLKEDYKHFIVVDLKLYCFKEFYKENKDMINCKFGLCEIWEMFGPNTCPVKLLDDLHIFNKFNVSHLHKYYEEDASLWSSFNQLGEPDAVHTEVATDSDSDTNYGHTKSKPIKDLYVQPEI